MACSNLIHSRLCLNKKKDRSLNVQTFWMPFERNNGDSHDMRFVPLNQFMPRSPSYDKGTTINHLGGGIVQIKKKSMRRHAEKTNRECKKKNSSQKFAPPPPPPDDKWSTPNISYTAEGSGIWHILSRAICRGAPQIRWREDCAMELNLT